MDKVHPHLHFYSPKDIFIDYQIFELHSVILKDKTSWPRNDFKNLHGKGS